MTSQPPGPDSPTEPVGSSEYFLSLEEEGLVKARRAGLFRATTTIGRAREIFAGELVRDHLPQRITIGRGELIDSRHRSSGELDGILLDINRPNFRIGGELYVPVESAVAVVEVKTSLAGGNLEDAIRKIASMKTLERTQHHGFFRTNGRERVLVPPRSPAGFIVAFDGPERGHLRERMANEAGEWVQNDYLRFGPEVVGVLGKGGLIKNDGIAFFPEPSGAHLDAVTTQLPVLQLILEVVQELVSRFGDLTYDRYSPR
jgi:hypothetical protein